MKNINLKIHEAQQTPRKLYKFLKIHIYEYHSEITEK